MATNDRESWQLTTDHNAPVSGSEMNRAGAPGSIQELLLQNTGYYVVCDFLIGTDRLVRKEGYLHDVSTGWMSLYMPSVNQYVVCDIYAVKFVTFYPPGEEPTAPAVPMM
ncbi:MAG: hypothetical protein IKL92_01850 [Oscillospiraceae bacterium]|nr:hypothetical protein [Oscillospiraceae bacterium]